MLAFSTSPIASSLADRWPWPGGWWHGPGAWWPVFPLLWLVIIAVTVTAAFLVMRRTLNRQAHTPLRRNWLSDMPAVTSQKTNTGSDSQSSAHD